MNFIDYCIATKNYSALSAVNEYTKSFAYRDERQQLDKRKRIAKPMSLLAPPITIPYRMNVAPVSNNTPKDKEQSKDNTNNVRK